MKTFEKNQCKRLQKQFQNQSGRTLLEMLMTLAIIGVLTIGGVAGYQNLSTRFEARTIAETISKYVIERRHEAMTNKGKTAHAKTNIEGPHGVSFDIKNLVDVNLIEIIIKTSRLELIEALERVESLDYITKRKDETSDTDGNYSMTLTFKQFKESSDKNHCEWMGKKWCSGLKAPVCISSDENCCVGVECDDCQECDNTGACSFNNKIKGTDGSCYSCDTSGAISTTQAECDKCLGREYIGSTCYKVCASDQFSGTDGNCYSCTNTSGISATATESAKCTDRFMNGDKTISYPCSYGSGVSTTALLSANCANRYMYSGSSYYNSCGVDKFQSSSGGCYSCSYTSAVGTTAAKSAACSNRFISNYGYSYPCDYSSMVYDVSESECAKCSDLVFINSWGSGYCGKLPVCASGYYATAGGVCSTCSDRYVSSTSVAECAKCGNRSIYDTANSTCALNECPDGYERYGSYGSCEVIGYNPCFAADTPITLANGTCKRADEITYDDDLLVWDFDKGCFTSAKPLWLKVAEEASQYNYLRFSDGSILKTIDQHRIFNKEKGRFTYPMTDDTPIGTTTLNAQGQWVQLVEKKIIKEKVLHYNIITHYHMNCFAGNVLTSCRFSNLYPIQDMKYVQETRSLVDYQEYCAVPRKWYDGLRLAEQPREINRGNDVHHAKSILDHIQHVYIDRDQASQKNKK